MPRRSLKDRDAAAEMLWKWALRLTGLTAFVYVGLAKDFDVPSPAYIGIFGLIGLPNVIGWQKMLQQKPEDVIASLSHPPEEDNP